MPFVSKMDVSGNVKVLWSDNMQGQNAIDTPALMLASQRAPGSEPRFGRRLRSSGYSMGPRSLDSGKKDSQKLEIMVVGENDKLLDDDQL